MRLKSLVFGAAAVVALAPSVGLSAGLTGGDKLSPPKKDADWRSTMLVCAEGKRVTAVFSGPERLTVATPQGEYKLKRVKGDSVRYNNDKAEFVVENGQAQFTATRSGEHRDCKPA